MALAMPLTGSPIREYNGKMTWHEYIRLTKGKSGTFEEEPMDRPFKEHPICKVYTAFSFYGKRQLHLISRWEYLIVQFLGSALSKKS